MSEEPETLPDLSKPRVVVATRDGRRMFIEADNWSWEKDTVVFWAKVGKDSEVVAQLPASEVARVSRPGRIRMVRSKQAPAEKP